MALYFFIQGQKEISILWASNAGYVAYVGTDSPSCHKPSFAVLEKGQFIDRVPFSTEALFSTLRKRHWNCCYSRSTGRTKSLPLRKSHSDRIDTYADVHAHTAV